MNMSPDVTKPVATKSSGGEIERLMRENADLRRRLEIAEHQRDALSPVVRNLALNPFSDEQDLRDTARRVLRSVQ